MRGDYEQHAFWEGHLPYMGNFYNAHVHVLCISTEEVDAGLEQCILARVLMVSAHVYYVLALDKLNTGLE